MKKFFSIALLATVIAVISGCSKKVDPIHGTQPLNEAFSQRIPTDKITYLRQKGDVLGLFSHIDRYRKFLTANIVSQYPNIQEGQNIELILGTGFADAIEAGDGQIYKGEFSNELIIIVKDSCKTDTVFFWGGQKPRSKLNFSTKADFGYGEKFTFTIDDTNEQKVDSLIKSLKDWDVVVNAKIPQKDKDGKILEEQSFQKYLTEFKPYFRQGDVIDAIRGKIFDKNNQEVTVEQRKAEMRKSTARKKRR